MRQFEPIVVFHIKFSTITNLSVIAFVTKYLIFINLQKVLSTLFPQRPPENIESKRSIYV